MTNILPATLTLIVAGLMLTGYIMQVTGQAEKSQMITPVTAEILEDMKPVDGAIITNSFTLSLWVSALAEAPTYTTWNAQPPAFFTEDDKRVRCVLGWRNFRYNRVAYRFQDGDTCDPIQAAEELGAKWVLIEGKFPWYFGEIYGVPGVYGSLDYHDPWAELPNLPWLEPVHQRGSTAVYRIIPTARHRAGK